MFSERTDINYYTARRLADMADSLGRLAAALDEEQGKAGQLTKGDGIAAMQTSAALVCEGCSRCNLYADGEKEDSYYLPYLLRSFEQKGRIEKEDMPRLFQTGCRKKEAYLAQLNRSLGRAAMNLSWKNRFFESRDAVILQFRELSSMLEEFSRQIDRAKDISGEYEYQIRKCFRKSHMAVENLLMLEYENGQKEAYVTARTTGGRCVTSRDAAELMGQAMEGTRWSPARDSRSVITKNASTVRFLEEGSYRLLFGAARVPRCGGTCSGDNYAVCENRGSRVIMSLSDGMGSGETASRESSRVVELTEQLLEAGFPPRPALKMVNTVLFLAGEELHPATLDVSCIDLYTAELEVMKLGAVPTFVMGREGVEILEAGQVPLGVFHNAEPVILSRKLCAGDRIVMMTDGVLDALGGEEKEQVMKRFLEGMDGVSPQELAERILDFAVSAIPAPRDDMSVLTAGIWKRRG